METMVRCYALLVLAITAGVARADDTTEADKLFEEGRELARTGDFRSACDRFQRSFDLDHSPGIEMNLADCQEHLGHPAQAWHLFESAAAKFERAGDTRATFAHERAKQLAGKLATIVVTFAEPRPAGLAILVDGQPLAATTDVVEPHAVDIVATAPGKRASRVSKLLAAGDVFTFRVELVDEPAATGIDRDPAPTTAPSARRGRVRLALGAGAVAVAAGGATLVLGAIARRDYNSAVATNCMHLDRLHCDSNGVAQIDHANRIANIATITGIAALAFATTAAIVYVTAPRDTIVAPMATTTSAGVAVTQRF